MRHALRLAERQLGQTWPNPAVGAVVVKDGTVVGIGATANGGRPHAEPLALSMAGEKAKGATLYVTLEPCSHQGKTPPCVDAVIASGIARVVVATHDVNPKVNGQGIAQLQAAGIEVVLGVEEKAARKINQGFFSRIEKNRPLISLKIATSSDGNIAAVDGEHIAITGEQARSFGHVLRAQHDAILTGIGTVLADDPLLTCRLPGLEGRSPLRIVLDSHVRIPLSSQLVRSARAVPVWIMTCGKDGEKIDMLTQAGATVITLPPPAGGTGLSLPHVVHRLAQEGITRLLVEAGAKLNGAFFREGLIDQLYWFRAGHALGSGALPAFGEAQTDAIKQLAEWQKLRHRSFGTDILDIVCSPAL